eukprot:6448023-Amphidinium_carterae.1
MTPPVHVLKRLPFTVRASTKVAQVAWIGSSSTARLRPLRWKVPHTCCCTTTLAQCLHLRPPSSHSRPQRLGNNVASMTALRASREAQQASFCQATIHLGEQAAALRDDCCCACWQDIDAEVGQLGGAVEFTEPPS